MDSLDLQVLSQARDWHLAGHRVWLVTVIETWGSAPRPPGALLALRDDALVVGSVSGGCVEDDLIDRIRSGERVELPTLIVYGVSKEEAARFGLPCGGNLRLVQEPLLDIAWIDDILDRTAKHEIVLRSLNLKSGQIDLQPGKRGDQFVFDGACVTTVFGPRWRLLIIGAGQLSRVLAPIAQALDFEVICCDPREEYFKTWDTAGSTFTRDMPDEVVVAMKIDMHTAVVALTHDPKLDDLALIEALKSSAFYIGALGSRGNTAKRKERLALFDLSQEQIDRLHGPIGLHLGSRTPAEIAVSIMAEITAVKNGINLFYRSGVSVF